MAQSNSARQQAYRKRHLEDVDGGSARLTVILSAGAKAQLTRLARHAETSQRETLERLLAAAEKAIVSRLRDPSQYYGAGIGGAVAWYGPARVMALFGIGGGEFDVPLLIMAKADAPRTQQSGAVVLPVSGRIVNPTDSDQPLFDILVEMRDVQGRVVYTWTIPRPAPTVGPRKSVSFDSATVNPPKNAVKLKFVFIGAATR